MNFHIEGTPIAKARHRMFRTKHGIKAYDKQSCEKEMHRWIFKRKMDEKGYKIVSSALLNMELTVGIPYPKKYARAKIKPYYVKSRPDLDNYVKYYQDVMNGIVYKDDSQIVSLQAKKVYKDMPFVEINLHEVSDAF